MGDKPSGDFLYHDNGIGNTQYRAMRDRAYVAASRLMQCHFTFGGLHTAYVCQQENR